MVGGLPSLFCSAQNNVEMFFQFSLPHELVKLARSQTDFIGDFMF
jgi:hypothetical protein